MAFATQLDTKVFSIDTSSSHLYPNPLVVGMCYLVHGASPVHKKTCMNTEGEGVSLPGLALSGRTPVFLVLRSGVAQILKWVLCNLYESK